MAPTQIRMVTSYTVLKTNHVAQSELVHLNFADEIVSVHLIILLIQNYFLLQ